MLKLTFSEPNRNLSWNDNVRYSFPKNITSQARFSTRSSNELRCRSPGQHKSRGATNSHTGNSTSTPLCTTSSPSFSFVSKGRGRGRGSVVPCLVGYPSPLRPCGSLTCGSMCCGLSLLAPPPVREGERLAWGGIL